MTELAAIVTLPPIVSIVAHKVYTQEWRIDNFWNLPEEVTLRSSVFQISNNGASATWYLELHKTRSSFEHIDDEGRECVVQLRPCFGGAYCPRYGITGRVDGVMCHFQTLPRNRVHVRPLPTSPLGGIFQCDCREVRKSLWMNNGSLTLVANISVFDRAEDQVFYNGDVISSTSQ